MAPKAMSHVALGVRDFERSLHFYRDLLGLQVSQEGTEVEGSEYQQGIYERENRKFRFAILRSGKENVGPYGMSEEAPVIALIAPLACIPLILWLINHCEKIGIERATHQQHPVKS